MTAARLSLAMLCAALGGGGLWLYFAGGKRPAPPVATLPTPGNMAQSLEPPPPVAKAPVPSAAPAATGDGMLLLPDGSKVPPLNGVQNPPKLVWNNPEWSPIVRTERNGDIDWYVHADGSYSTTIMLWRSELGRTDAFSYALHPRDPVPTAPLPDAGTGR